MKYFFLFLSFCCALGAYEYKLSICAIFQNEAPYLKEWIDFHRKVGVEHFWLYNHLSDDNYKDVLKPYIEEGLVELIDWERSYNNFNEFIVLQCDAYNNAISRSKHKTKWLAVVDIDEFIYPVVKKDLIAFLKDYEEFSSIGANWQGFGTSHVARLAPGESLLKKLVWKGKLDRDSHRYVKCIVKPKHVAFYRDPHSPVLKRRAKQVNADRISFSGSKTSYCSIDKIRINHYWTRDEHYLMHDKLSKRTKWPMDAEECLKRAAEMNEVYDTTIHRFLD